MGKMVQWIAKHVILLFSGVLTICEDFLEKYWDYEKNVANPWSISWASNKKVWIKCQEKDYHGSYKIACGNFSIQKQRCPYCSNRNGKVHYLDSLGSLYSEVLDIWSDKNKKTPFQYSPKSKKIVIFKCMDGKHDDYERNIKESNEADFRCPECVKERSESFLQEKVRLYLKELNYDIFHENNCSIVPKNPKTKFPLPFDNEIKELKLIIEVHGEQHYKITNFAKLTARKRNTTPEYELHYQKLKDRYKRIFAKSQGYFYLEIPYLTDDKDETWKRLIDEKLKKVKCNYKSIDKSNNLK